MIILIVNSNQEWQLREIHSEFDLFKINSKNKTFYQLIDPFMEKAYYANDTINEIIDENLENFIKSYCCRI